LEKATAPLFPVTELMPIRMTGDALFWLNTL
jgi:hypothetical protein